MADISKVRMLNGTEYNYKDAKARSDIEGLKADLGAKVGIFSKTAGYYINLTTDPVVFTPQQSSSGMAFSIIDCSAGDEFVINAEGGTNGRAWGFVDSSNHVLSMADANATAEDLELTAPNDAVKLVINDKGDGVSYKVGSNLASKVGALSKNSGLSQDVKAALLACFDHAYWTDDNGGTYYQALYDALYPASGLVSITAVFAPGTATIYSNDNLNTLKAYLTVTGLYENGQSKAITDYALSGSLSVGTNTITVSCDGITTTFSVSVANALDKIAFGTLTYRDIFITGNYYILGGFESINEVPSTETTLSNGDSYWGSFGDPLPSITTDVVNKGLHAFMWASTGSSQMKYATSRLPASGNVLIAFSQYLTRYDGGHCGMQFNINTDNDHKRTVNVEDNEVSDGFVPVVSLSQYDVTGGQNTPAAEIFCGSWSKGNSDGYIDDVVIAIVPDTMTLETATTLYNNYISMI